MMSFPVFGASVSEDYRRSLINAGFPESYIPMLSALHEKHPDWIFRPYDITSLRSDFTWEYVIGQMMSNPARNLVVKSSWAPSPFSALGDANYAPYRVNNGVTYDSGTWYAATEDAVRYFMDPRNFLNDTDCFMFLDWSYDGTPSITDAQVDAVLGSSVFAHTVIPDLDGKTTYASFINETGTALHVNPLFLAARLVQENGNGTSPMVNGTTGDYLGRPELNGLYNFFNINAGGTGYDQIYTNGMNESLTGTPTMASEWGGSASWDTRWKAVYGGIYTIKTKYVDVYRNTLYLQKFNTDPRSKNVFSGYMQNIAAPLTEGRNFGNGLVSANAMEHAYTFLIPVYAGMPSSPSPDPGNGVLLYSYTEPPVTSVTLRHVTYTSCLDMDNTSGIRSDVPVTASYTLADNASLTVRGWSVATAKLNGFYLTFDNAPETYPMTLQPRPDVFAGGYARFESYCDAAHIGFTRTVNMGDLVPGKHTVILHALYDGGSYVAAVITLNITHADTASGTYNRIERIGDDDCTAFAHNASLESSYTVLSGTASLPLKGWSVSTAGARSFEYSIDGGSYKPLAAPSVKRLDVFNAGFMSFAAYCDSDKIGFDDTADISSLDAGTHTLRIYCKNNSAVRYLVGTVTLNVVDALCRAVIEETDLRVHSEVNGNAVLFAAFYDEDGRLTQSYVLPFGTRLETEFDLTLINAVCAKFMIADDNLRPLCNACEVRL